MSVQRARSAVTADHRSIIPDVGGVPWWAAIVIAATATAVGIAFDAGSGDKELTSVFSALYVLGCVVAALAVRQSGVFTAVIQPPLILFCSVPSAYWLFHGATFPDLKGILINCGYPLIERFPLMLFTSAGVLLIGMYRWYFGSSHRAAESGDGAPGSGQLGSHITKLVGRLTAVLDRDAAHATGSTTARRRPGTERPRRSPTRSRASGSSGAPRRTTRSDPTRSRHIRPPLDEMDDMRDARSDRPRRPRPAAARGDEPPRRRPRPAQDSPRRGQSARGGARDPQLRKERPTARSNRSDGYQPAEPPPRRRPASSATNGSSSTHHPVSRVRYRGTDSGEDSRREPRVRSRSPRRDEPDSWDYDA